MNYVALRSNGSTTRFHTHTYAKNGVKLEITVSTHNFSDFYVISFKLNALKLIQYATMIQFVSVAILVLTYAL